MAFIALVVAIAAINLTFGFALAVFLEKPLAPPQRRSAVKLETSSEHPQPPQQMAVAADETASEEPEIPFEPPADPIEKIRIEKVIDEWLEADPTRMRVMSAILVNLDDATRAAAHGESSRLSNLIDQVAKVAAGLIRKDRGFDRVAYYQNDKLVVLLADAAIRNATNTAERIRQTVLSTMTDESQSLAVTVSCAVSEWQADEGFSSLIGRLAYAMDAANEAGGNCTAISTADAIRITRPTKIDVAVGQASNTPNASNALSTGQPA